MSPSPPFKALPPPSNFDQTRALLSIPETPVNSDKSPSSRSTGWLYNDVLREAGES
jgi:hypothetical protein